MFKTTAMVKCSIIEPDQKQVMAAKASIGELVKSNALKQTDFIKYAQENKQEDLLYFKAIYATCGFNLNDDVFVKDEFWKARTTPIWKPANWQHDSGEIVGVIYATQAQDLQGNPLNIESGDVPESDFEIVVYGAIYKYTFPDIAKEVKSRSEAGELYVSMETWFSDFSYAMLDGEKGTISLVDRNDKTIALDKSLKAYGGTGKFEEKRVGRVLRGMTFGGMGFVERPANPRSAGTTATLSEEIKEIPMDSKVEVIVKDAPELKGIVEAASKVPALEQSIASMKEDAGRTKEKLEKAELATKLSDAILAELDLTVAGVTKTTPPEIARIDAAKTGEEAYKAKLAFLAQTGKAFAEIVEANKKVLAEKDAKIAELEKVKAEWDAEKAVIAAKKAEDEKKLRDAKRKGEVKAVLNDEKVVETLTPNFIDLTEDAYNKWLDEKKVIAGVSLKKDGGAGSPEEEGKSGETKAKGNPRDLISVASVLENAKVETVIKPGEVEKPADVTVGFASLLKSKEAPKKK